MTPSSPGVFSVTRHGRDLAHAPTVRVPLKKVPPSRPGDIPQLPTAVITDSSACIPATVMARYDIRVVPVRLHVGSETLHDREGSAYSSVYRALEAGVEVKSSTPSPGEYLEALHRCHAEGAVVITPAVEFTGMHRSAAIAAGMAAMPTAVIDCRTVAGGQALVVLAAARSALDGGTVQEVVQAAASASARCEMLALVEHLAQLGRSGRVARSTLQHAARAARSVFRITDGQVAMVGSASTSPEALQALVEGWEDHGGPETDDAVVFHASRPRLAGGLARRVGASLVTEFSPAMAVHTGPGVVGLAWLRQLPR